MPCVRCKVRWQSYIRLKKSIGPRFNDRGRFAGSHNSDSQLLVPFLDINAQNLPLERELTEAFTRVLRSGQFILGNEVSGLENELGAFLGIEHVIGVSSGTDAILLALMTLEIGPGDEVLCPAFTFFATAGCVARVGAKPVFVDVDRASYNMDPADAARKITKRTKAMIPVHLFGQCADMDGIGALAAENNLFVIEDAAQSLGARYRRKPAGTIGHFGAFSFYPTKNLGGLGDGGLLVCRDEALAAKARALRNHGAEKTYHHAYVGGNFRLDALQAAFLRVKLRELGSYSAQRKRHALYYTEKLSKLSQAALGGDAESNTAWLVLPPVARGCDHAWNQYTVRVTEKRDNFRDFLSDRGIHTAIYYPVPLNRQECFLKYGQRDNCPESAQLAGEVLSLPIYGELERSQLAEVVKDIGEWLDQRNS